MGFQFGFGFGGELVVGNHIVDGFRRGEGEGISNIAGEFGGIHQNYGTVAVFDDGLPQYEVFGDAGGKASARDVPPDTQKGHVKVHTAEHFVRDGTVDAKAVLIHRAAEYHKRNIRQAGQLNGAVQAGGGNEILSVGENPGQLGGGGAGPDKNGGILRNQLQGLPGDLLLALGLLNAALGVNGFGGAEQAVYGLGSSKNPDDFVVLPQKFHVSADGHFGNIGKPGFSLVNYREALNKLLLRSMKNTTLFGVVALAIIIVIAVLIAYLVVRRPSVANNAIDTMAMLPYIMPGAVIGLALLIAFGQKPFALTGTMTIMIIALVIRRLPYTIRSATATLMQISPSIEEAALSLGASKAKTFIQVTVPMMANGILSGAILSWVAIVTELSSAIILYNNKSITLTMSTYVAITRGKYGQAAAFAAILTVITTISLIIYIAISKTEDVEL